MVGLDYDDSMAVIGPAATARPLRLTVLRMDVNLQRELVAKAEEATRKATAALLEAAEKGEATEEADGPLLEALADQANATSPATSPTAGRQQGWSKPTGLMLEGKVLFLLERETLLGHRSRSRDQRGHDNSPWDWESGNLA